MLEVSSLYARYHGFMLGLFCHFLASPGLRLRRILMKCRMRDLLSDLGIPQQVLPTANMSARDRRLLEARLERALVKVDVELENFFRIGTACARLVLKHDDQSNAAGDVVSLLYEYVDHKWEFGPTFMNTVNDLPSKASLTTLVTPTLEVLRASLNATRWERRTCFVAMPFESEYFDLYRTILSPALRSVRLRPIVAWGNIESEEYQEVLFSLIRRCGHTLTVVTENNPNVLMELGYAVGCNRRTLPVVARKHSAASNIRRKDLLRYDRNDRGIAAKELTAGIKQWAKA
jgi:hypothetical protein